MKQVFFCVLLVLASCSFMLGQTYKVLWSFGGSPNDGANPTSDFVFDSAGNMYGTTQTGGNSTNVSCLRENLMPGCGTVFELSPNSDGSWTETVVYNFCANYPTGVCPDGQQPTAGLAMDSAGNLYGTTRQGGVSCAVDGAGCGTVFELSPPSVQGGAWTQEILYVFCSMGQNPCPDGALPTSHLTLDSAGNLYGTTTEGGGGAWYGGTVFELSPENGAWTEAVLYAFCTTGELYHCPDGTNPQAGVTFANLGNLYGTTEWGGSPSGGGTGTLFELSRGRAAGQKMCYLRSIQPAE